jgi:hypothetical protein
MKLVIEIETGNSAFEDDEEGEISRIIEVIAGKVNGGATGGSCFDFNGNKVGQWEMTGGEK